MSKKVIKIYVIIVAILVLFIFMVTSCKSKVEESGVSMVPQESTKGGNEELGSDRNDVEKEEVLEKETEVGEKIEEETKTALEDEEQTSESNGLLDKLDSLVEDLEEGNVIPDHH